MIPTVTLREALDDPALLAGVLVGESWDSWKPLMLASVGEVLTEDERAIFKKFTGRDHEPGEPVEEAVIVKGRRAGGSRVASVMLSYFSALCRHPSLVRGERGVALCVASDQRQSDVILDYTQAAFEASPVLRQLIANRTARELRLTNGIDIEVRAADFRRLRGLTFIAVIADEVSFWMTDSSSANPDSEILNAVRPGLATTSGPLFVISSPYAKRGELWNSYQKHYGPDGDPLILVAKGSSLEFNPTLPQRVVDRAIERDPANAAAEYGGNFRNDIESFVNVEAVRACVSAGVFERPYQRGINYFGFVDPSGGSSDSFSLAVGHVDRDKQTVVLDCLREITPPFSPEIAVSELCKVLKSYHIGRVTGDRYAGEWPVEQFQKFNVHFDQSAKPKSDLYIDLLPLVNSARVELLDHAKFVAQLCNLERRTARGGKDSIDHPQGAHDDLVNVVAGLCAVNNMNGGYDALQMARNFNGSNREDDPDGNAAWRAARLSTYLQSGGTIDIASPSDGRVFTWR